MTSGNRVKQRNLKLEMNVHVVCSTCWLKDLMQTATCTDINMEEKKQEGTQGM